MRIIFMGTPGFSVNILNALCDEHEVVLVVTQPDRLVGRKQILTPSPVKELALSKEIKIFQPNNIKNEYDVLLNTNADLIVTAAYGQFVPMNVINSTKYGAINVHASLLPKYRGGSPIHRAIQNGDLETGISVIRMVKKMDAGNILHKVEVPIDTTDNVSTLTEKLSFVGSDAILDAIDLIESGDFIEEVQDESLVTIAPNITREEEKINWNSQAIDIYNHIRAFDAWPGTYTLYENNKIKIFPVRIIGGKAKPGEIVEITKEGIKVGTKEGLILITDLQVPGKKKMNIKDFINGNKLLREGGYFN